MFSQLVAVSLLKGTISWTIKVDTPDPKFAVQLEEMKKQMANPFVQVKIEEFRKKMEDPSFRGMLDKDPAEMAKVVQIIRIADAVNLNSLTPSSMRLKKKNCLFSYSGGMLDGVEFQRIR